MVRQQLQRQHVDQPLQAVDGEGNSDGSVLFADGGVVIVADDDYERMRTRCQNDKKGNFSERPKVVSTHWVDPFER